MSISNNDTKPISHHIFLCPLRLVGLQFDNLDELGSDWEKFNFTITNPKDYNEQNYFYPFVHDALFREEGSPVKQYRHGKYSASGGAVFRLEYAGRSLELNVDDVILNIYETGIAVLSFHLTNNQHDSLADIKIINDVGRRIYPPFLGTRTDSPDAKWTDAVKNTLLAERVVLIDDDGHKSTANFSRFDYKSDTATIFSYSSEADRPTAYSKLLPSYITHLLNGLKCTEISPVIDDRMFVLSWIVSDRLANQIKDGERWKDSEDWHNLIFCDKDSNSNHANHQIRRKLNEKHTYTRWTDWGTFFGVSRYSFVVLSGDNEYARGHLLTHVMTLYFQMVQLCLVQRSSILRYSRDAATLAKDIKCQSIDNNSHKGNNTLSDANLTKIKELQVGYVRFINRLYFREVTAQEQGIELYEMLQEMMRVPDHLADLDSEINEMISLASLIRDDEAKESQRKQNQKLTDLTTVATIFLIPTLITGVLGVNIINWSQVLTWDVLNILGWIVFISVFVVSVIAIKYALEKLTCNFLTKLFDRGLLAMITILTVLILALIAMFIILKFYI